ncbi:MAG: NHL repeat-containing protein [Gammaproteobacteria bacterium]|nr:NHL repeat-containing protein [Gammaproteobacteria bacterium]
MSMQNRTRVHPPGFRTAIAAIGIAVLTGCGGSGSSSSTTTLTLVPASVVLGQTDFTGQQPNEGGGADADTLNQAFGDVAVNSSGALFVTDTANNRVLGFNPVPTSNNANASFVLGQADFTSTTPNAGGATASNAGFGIPTRVSLSGNFFVVADTGNNRVLIYNSIPASNVPPDIVIGQSSFTVNSQGCSATALRNPTAAVIAGGKLIAVDQGNNRVLIWNSIPTANGTAADVVLGQPDFTTCTGNSATETQSSLFQPTDVWSDGFRLLVSDTGDSRVLSWTQIPDSNDAAANVVIGQSSFTFSSTSPSAATTNAPEGITSDGARIFVADFNNNRVLVFDSFPVANGASADHVLGQEDFTHITANDDNGDTDSPQDGVAEASPTARTLKSPTGVAYEATDGSLWVTDRGNNRVLKYDAAELSKAVGSSSS